MGRFKPMRSEPECTRTRLDEDDDHGLEWCPFRCYKLLAFSFDTGRDGKSTLFKRLDTSVVDEKEFKDKLLASLRGCPLICLSLKQTLRF